MKPSPRTPPSRPAPKPSRLLSICWILGLLLLVQSGLASAQTSSETSTDRIEALWDELQTLLQALPPDERLEVWKALQARLQEIEPREIAVVEPPKPEPVADVVEPKKPKEAPAADPPATPPEPTVVDTVTPKPIEPRPAAPEPAAPEPAAPQPAAPQPPTRGCNTLNLLDSDGDRAVTALDRYWRHLYLWLDDGDGQVDPRELKSPYDRGIRSISLSLRTFVKGKKKRARELPILEESYLLLDLDGDGWKSISPSSKDGALALDFDAVRSAGGPSYRDATGKPVEGILPFRPGWTVEQDGERVELRCPKP